MGEFGDFTLDNYRKLLGIAQKTHCFRSFNNYKGTKNYILWRHDIDFSVHSALKMAKIEKEEDVSATYFINLHSEFYNLLEKEIFELVISILNYGHKIGLHFDCHFYEIKNEKDLNRYLKIEKHLLEDLFDVPIEVFSFHNPMGKIFEFDKYEYAGMINTYAKYFREEVEYGSDSNGIWRHKSIEEVLKNSLDEPVQILTHPVWWQGKVMTPKQKVWAAIEGRAKNVKEDYLKLLHENDRELIG